MLPFFELEMRSTGLLRFLNLMANAHLVLTDSGGIQEETTILGVPCLTLRENTETARARPGEFRNYGMDRRRGAL